MINKNSEKSISSKSKSTKIKKIITHNMRKESALTCYGVISILNELYYFFNSLNHQQSKYIIKMNKFKL
jgi:plastocyanin domain-containing protein